MHASPTSLPIQCLALSHRTAPDALRERLAFSSDSLKQALKSARQNPELGRLVIVSTCERIELYTALPDSGPPNRYTLVNWLADWHGVDAETIVRYSEYRDSNLAAKHLFRVTTGLDATLLGEAQILSQVASAISTSISEHAASPVLKAVFKAAVKTGELARGTIWSRYPRTDIGTVAVDAALERLSPDPESAKNYHAVVVGAGTVGRLALQALQNRKIGKLTIANRTPANTAELIDRYKAASCNLQSLPGALREADLVIVATGASAHVLGQPMVAAALAQRTTPMVIADAAMPHNADPAIRSLTGATLLDLDDLNPFMRQAREERAAAIPEVEALIEQQLAPVAKRVWTVRSAIAPWSQPALWSASA